MKSIERPSLLAIRARVAADIEKEHQVGPLPRRSALRALGNSVAGQSHLMHGAIAQEARQILPTTATYRLDQHASLYEIKRKPAKQAKGTVLFEGTGGAGVPEGALLQSSSGVVYRTTGSALIPQGEEEVEAEVEAVETGPEGNLPEGASLVFLQPVAGIDQSVTVSSEDGIQGGADVEDLELWRARITQHTANRPGTGKQSDWEQWALEIAGVTRAWALKEFAGPGTVGVTFATDGTGIDGGPIPLPSKVNEVRDHVEARRRVGMKEVFYFAPEALLQAFSIRLDPDTLETRESVTAALEDLFLREAAPKVRMPRSRLRGAIHNAAGVRDHRLDLPVGDIVPTAVQLLLLGEITFSPLVIE